MELEQYVLDDFKVIKGENMAIVTDASYIWEGEHSRSPLDDERSAKEQTPIYVMFPMLVNLLERPDVNLVYIDGTGEKFRMITEGPNGTTIHSASDIVNARAPKGESVAKNLALYFKTYYLLRYYLFGGSKKYAVTKLNEGFMVYTNDTGNNNPLVWAGHKVY